MSKELKNDDWTVRLVLIKSLNDLWPCEFDRQQLVMDELKPWEDLGKNEDLKAHMEVQFCSAYLIT